MCIKNLHTYEGAPRHWSKLDRGLDCEGGQGWGTDEQAEGQPTTVKMYARRLSRKVLTMLGYTRLS
jgi:hypothetical protein